MFLGDDLHPPNLAPGDLAHGKAWVVRFTDGQIMQARRLRATEQKTFSEIAQLLNLSSRRQAEYLCTRAKTRSERSVSAREYLTGKLRGKKKVNIAMLAVRMSMSPEHIRRIILALKADGELPGLEVEIPDEERRAILTRIQRRRVCYSAEIVGNKDHKGKWFIDGRGWLTWEEVVSFSESLA